MDVACWGATLVSRSVVDAGVLPDPEWFFGLEDFDFFCRVREAGFEVLVDDVAARQVADQQTDAGRDAALRDRRPTDDDGGLACATTTPATRSLWSAGTADPAGTRGSSPTPLRHLQQARSRAERSAIVHGLWDGILGRMGENPRYRRRSASSARSRPGDRSTPAR